MFEESKLLGLICVLVLCGILIAGLAPFHAPGNHVSWLENANGLQLGHHSTVLSSGASIPHDSQPGTPCSIEIWLQPQVTDDASTILAFFQPPDAIPFSLHQSESDLVIQRNAKNEHFRVKGAHVLYLDDAFRNKDRLFITLTSDGQGTSVYRNGVLKRQVSDFQLTTDDLLGQMILGTSPVVNDSWEGRLFGLALYNQNLSPSQVLHHFSTWTARGRPQLDDHELVRALYLFDEHGGSIAHDHSGLGNDLDIPPQYTVPHEKFLEPFWKEYFNGWGYWKNVGINIGGFIPLGFFFCAYLAAVSKIRRPGLLTVLLGAATSLTIELLQSALPTRDSGTTDLITNTFGTGLGVLLYNWQGQRAMQMLAQIRAFAGPRLRRFGI